MDEHTATKMFSSEDMIQGFRAANRARKRRMSKNKENDVESSQERAVPVNENIDGSSSNSGYNAKISKRRLNSKHVFSEFRTPLSELSNNHEVNINIHCRKSKIRVNQSLEGINCNLFPDSKKNTMLDDVESYDDQIEESIIYGASLSDDGLFDSDSSYEEFFSQYVDTDSDSEECLDSSTKAGLMPRRRPRNFVPEDYASLGGPSVECSFCNSRMWKEERVNKSVTKGTPLFSICCKKGDVKLPPTPPTPSYLLELHNNKSEKIAFQRSIRLYNSMFSFTSTGGNIDHSINEGRGPYIYRLNGQNHHVFGSLIPDDGDTPKFCQLYIYDTSNEVNNRLRWVNVSDQSVVDECVVDGLTRMLDETNELVKEFRMARKW